MPRIARVVAIGYPHHITQRGNYRQKVFASDAEYSLYLKWFSKYANDYHLSVLAYCLMPNHVHFVAVPHNEYSMARTFNTCHMLYSQYFNRKNSLTGHLWQGRFFSCALDERYLYAAVRYIENNPVRAKLVKQPEDWKWSSVRMHLKNGSGILELEDIDKYMEIKSWNEYLTQQEDATIIKHIRSGTLSGKPLGDDMFLAKIEKLSGRMLKSLPRGRPKEKK